MKPRNVKRVCLLFFCSNHSERGRLSGALRYAASRPDWDCRAIDGSSFGFADEVAKLRRDWKPDGIIYTAAVNNHKAILRQIGDRKVYRAEIDPVREGDDPKADVTVSADGEQIITEAVSFFLRRGHGNFAFYGTELADEKPYSEGCEKIYKVILRHHGKEPFVFREPTNASWTERINLAAKWVKDLPKPCAILAYTDELSRGLLNACRAAHVSVPEQIAILGIDDAPEICETCRPTLSSIRIDFEQAGYLAAEALDTAMRSGKRGPRHQISYGLSTICERMSTQDLRGSRRIVSAARELIRTMPLGILSVSAVTERLHVSRRLVEQNFKKVVGHGIHAEIVRRRLETLRALACTTSTPLGELILSCGFGTSATARTAFRKQYGISLSSLRK